MGLSLLLLLLLLMVARADAKNPHDALVPALAHIREALGYAALAGNDNGWLITANKQAGGRQEQYSLAFTPSGKFAEKFDGPVKVADSYDGRSGWVRSGSEIPRPFSLEGLEKEQLTIWVETGRWLAPDSPFTISIAPSQGSEKTLVLEMTLKQGLMPAQLSVDRATWHPLSLTYTTTQGAATLRFDDYRTENGICLAYRWTHEGSEDGIHVLSLSRLPATGLAPYLLSSSQPESVQFDATVSPLVPFRRAPAGHLLVHPLVDGQDVGWFLLDSGCNGMIIDTQTADRLKMPSLAATPVRAFGGPSQSTAFRQSQRFVIGPLTLKNLMFTSLDLSPLTSQLRVPISGVCGYDFFSQAVVELDLPHDSLAIYSPAVYSLHAGAWQEILSDGGTPCVHATFNGLHEGLFSLDTGSNTVLTFNAPAVSQFHLLEGQPTSVGHMLGVDGLEEVRYGRIQGLQLGAYKMTFNRVTFSLAKQGPLSSPYLTGNIGLTLLVQIKVVFDYPAQRVAFFYSTPTPQ